MMTTLPRPAEILSLAIAHHARATGDTWPVSVALSSVHFARRGRRRPDEPRLAAIVHLRDERGVGLADLHCTCRTGEIVWRFIEAEAGR